MIGRTLSHFTITAKLGEGGMGVVWKAVDETLDREVAIKVLPAELAANPRRLKRLQREAKALASLDHPHIVPIYSFGSAEGLHFLTMAYVEGESLESMIPEEGLSTERVLELAIPLADALRAAHERGIVHRDLKPSNVMVDRDGRLRVLDFGLAKRDTAPSEDPSQLSTQGMSELMTREGAILGTFPYLSPEQAEGKSVDARSDLFSLGVMLYEMATGGRPFQGESGISLITSILRDSPKPVTEVKPDVPPRLGRILERCLEKDPDARFASAEAVRDELKALRRELATGQSGIDRAPGAIVLLGSRPLQSLLAALAVVAVSAGVWLWRAQGPAPLQVASLVVLPFKNLSGDPEQGYFVDGMTEAMITDLARVGSLRVISRTSAMRYRDSDKSLGEIARELGVDAVVDGSVIRSAEQVRVTIRLVEARSDEIWANNFDREMRDILSLQSEVARAIAVQIEARLTPAEERLLAAQAPVNPEAYDAFLRGQFHLFSLNPDGIERAREYFELALEKDPNFALAYTGLADIWGGRVQWGATPPGVGMPEVRRLSLKALELDETLPEAHNLLAKVFFYVDWDWQAAEREFQRGVALCPNSPTLRMTYSLFLGSLNRHEEGLAQIERAIAMDPLNPLWEGVRGWHVMMSGQSDEAIEVFRETLSENPALLPAQQTLWSALRHEQRYEEALIEAKKTFTLRRLPEVVEAMASGYAESGYSGAMHAAAEELAERSAEEFVLPSLIAKLYAHAQDNDRAFEWLEKAYELRDPFMVHLGVEPDWVGLRSDPRFGDLLSRIGLPE